VKSWVSHCCYFIPTKAVQHLYSVVLSTPTQSIVNCTWATLYNCDATITFFKHNNERQVAQQLSIFLFHLLTATAVNLLNNKWPTWSLNAAQWSKKYHAASTYWSRKSFPLQNETRCRNPTTCSAEPLFKNTDLGGFSG